jgi:hypothetical protein
VRTLGNEKGCVSILTGAVREIPDGAAVIVALVEVDQTLRGLRWSVRVVQRKI